VFCKLYAKKKKKCCLLLLSKKYSNCKFLGLIKYKPIDLLVLNFAKIDTKIARLDKIEEQAKQAKEAAIAAL